VHRLPVPKVTIVGDTSGSMGDEDIGKILSVVYDACENLGKVSVVSCDAAAHEPVEVRHIEDLREHLLGGGGTDMVEGIKVASEASNPPDAIVVVTDGDTPWPETEPDVPVTVVLTRNSRWNTPPAWAEVVVAEDVGTLR
jgi:predicted metal-dependent peptidase